MKKATEVRFLDQSVKGESHTFDNKNLSPMKSILTYNVICACAITLFSYSLSAQTTMNLNNDRSSHRSSRLFYSLRPCRAECGI